MKLPLIALAVASVTFAGVAIAQPHRGPGPAAGGFGILQHDANGDGRLTRAELDAAQKARFDAIDTNKDGAATPEEFKAFRDGQSAERREEFVKTRFAALDTDNNGQISPAEFAAPAKDRDGRGMRDGRKGGHGGPGLHRAGKRGGGDALPGDANNDGKISLAEFGARGAEAFARADANKDGVVTVTELQALRPGRT